MLRDVVLHLNNEQPLLADLPNEPSPSDTCLICTNLRELSGKPPLFVERADSTFIFPMQFVRFVEIKASSVAEDQVERPVAPERAERVQAGPRRLKSGKPEPPMVVAPEPAQDEAADDDYGASLERLAWVGGNAASPPLETPAARKDGKRTDPDPDGDDFLRRVREV
jgi:hypothetical protein